MCCEKTLTLHPASLEFVLGLGAAVIESSRLKNTFTNNTLGNGAIIKKIKVPFRADRVGYLFGQQI